MTKKVFYYYEMEIPTALKDEYAVEAGSTILKEKLKEYVELTNDKNSRIIQDFIFSNIAFFKWNENKAAVSLEFMTERDYEKHQICINNFMEWMRDTHNIVMVHDVARMLDYSGMQEVDWKTDEPNSYWKTKVYFNETLPAERGFDTTCLLEESDGTMTWVEFWTREL